MDEPGAKINKEYDQWLEKNGLGKAMGVIVKLGTFVDVMQTDDRSWEWRFERYNE